MKKNKRIIVLELSTSSLQKGVLVAGAYPINGQRGYGKLDFIHEDEVHGDEKEPKIKENETQARQTD